MKQTLLIAAALVAFALPVAAQTTDTGKTFRIQATHDLKLPANAVTANYPVYVDGVKVLTAPISANVNGTVSIDVPGVSRGKHTVSIAAASLDRESPRTAELAFTTMDPAPSTPSGLQFVAIQQTADGGLTFKLINSIVAQDGTVTLNLPQIGQ